MKYKMPVSAQQIVIVYVKKFKFNVIKFGVK